jgi:bifunctional UDP-N-acetylglucosamine pyrophosphorylase/glucosamine-1-phosphate N-acetyltransferase
MIDHAIIMAASPSRRMESLTRTRPKAMLPLVGKPLIAHVMERFYQAGVRRFTVVVGENEGSAVMWLTSAWHTDADLRFAPQGHRRGTASTLFATRHLIDRSFLIASCDNLVPQDHVAHLASYFDTHPRDAAVLTLYYAPTEITESAGVLLDPRGGVMVISENPIGAHQGYMAALPVYGFTPKVLSYLDRVPVAEESGERALAAAMQMMIDDGELVGAVEAPGRIRVDTPSDLLAANVKLMGELPEPVLLSDIPASTEIRPPVYVDAGVVIGRDARLGPNVYLERGTVVGQGTTILNAVVLGRRIGPGKTIEGEVVKDDRP